MKPNQFNRRRFLKTTAALVSTAALPRHLLAGSQDSRPNIVLIMADDLGFECIRANGGAYETPVLDEMAGSGIRFEHCYAQPLCTPSRVQIMTGLYNVRNYVKFGVLDQEQKTFAHLLKQRSYATCAAGKWQLGKEVDSPQFFGFDESCLWQHTRGRKDPDGHDTRYPNPRLEINGREVNFTDGEFGPDVTSDFLCDFIERHREQPFLAYYPMILTHCPFCPTPDSPDWDPQSPGSLTYRGDPKYFGDMVRYTDKIVGKILAKLDALGLRENTLVLFTGDNGTDKPVVSMLHGQPMRGGKGLMTDAGTRVPLIASWPGKIPAGLVCDDLVDFSDFVPTLCEATGTRVPAGDGRSFLPQLRGETGQPRDWIYCWFSRNGGSVGQEWARTRRYKLYRSGEFFEVANDVLEQTPLVDGELSDPARAAKKMLQSALNQFAEARFSGLKP